MIEGEKKDMVLSAKFEIDKLILRASKNKKEFTHFFSIPLNSLPNLTQKVQSFIKEVSSGNNPEPNVTTSTGGKGKVITVKKKNTSSSQALVPPSVCAETNKLHVTLMMLSLNSEQEVKKACRVLNDCREEILELVSSSKLKLELKGLECMQNDSKNARVVHICVNDEENKLQEVLSLLKRSSIQAGLIEEEPDNQLMHVTIFNTKFSSNKLSSFDASSLLEKYGNADFGKYEIHRICLSSRSKTGKIGTRTTLSTLPAPSTGQRW